MEIRKIAVITSGMSRGSNFEAIINHINVNKLPIEVAFVSVNRKAAPIRERCKKHGIESIFISTKDRSVFESKLTSLILDNSIDLIVLAGFMRKLSEEFLHNIDCPIINVHPALLPKFGGKGMYGCAVHKAVFEAKEAMSGATVHYVNKNYDEGDIITQEAVDISDCKSSEEIGKKVLTIEHKIYPETIERLLAVE